ncbi:MAG: CoA pyrophosphatase [Bacteroidales bacterium]
MDLINFVNKIQRIENELKKPLPGESAQFLMMPQTRPRNLDFNKENAKLSSVLLLLFPKNNELHLVFIERAESGGVHSGQISFPGGKYDKTDKDLVHTALRETFEEIGVDLQNVKILGSLSDLFIPVSNYIVCPFVGCCEGELNFRINYTEVASVIEVSLSHLLNEKNQTNGRVKVLNNEYLVPVYNVSDFKIWGATAMILSEFLTVLRNAGF